MSNEEIKAEELIRKFANQIEDFSLNNEESIRRDAIACAKIAVEEILKNINATILFHKESKSLPLNKNYWLEVKGALMMKY